MQSLLLACLWIAAGFAIAAALPTPADNRSAWLPVAVIFGPLWLFVAIELRRDAEALELQALPARARHGSGDLFSLRKKSAA